MPTLYRDYETRSVLELPEVGAHVYAAHASTDVWCCAYAVDDGEVQLWTPDTPVPDAFVEAAHNPDYVGSAFNDSFERAIEQHIMGPRYGWPLIPIERRRCSQAAAMALALPASLGAVAVALELEYQKDEAGHRLMLQMARPRRPRKGDPNEIYWVDDPKKIERLQEYCRQDVRTERAVQKRIGFLPDSEQRVWELDARINDRGFYLDSELLDGALRVAADAELQIGREITDITGGAVTTVNEVARLLTWLRERGCDLADVRKKTLQAAITNESLAPEARRAIELRLAGAHAAARKLATMRNWCGADGRVRGALKYHGASTGRWASWGVQIHNLKRPETEDLEAAMAAALKG